MTKENSNEWVEKLRREYEQMINKDPCLKPKKREELLERLQKKTGKTREEILAMIDKM